MPVRHGMVHHVADEFGDHQLSIANERIGTSTAEEHSRHIAGDARGVTELGEERQRVSARAGTKLRFRPVASQ